MLSLGFASRGFAVYSARQGPQASARFAIRKLYFVAGQGYQAAPGPMAIAAICHASASTLPKSPTAYAHKTLDGKESKRAPGYVLDPTALLASVYVGWI